MTRYRLIFLCMVAALLSAGWVLVSMNAQKYRVSFTSLVELWADVFRDADQVGLTLTRVSDRTEMELGAELSKTLKSFMTRDQKLQKYAVEIGQRLVQQVQRKNIAYQFHVINIPKIQAYALPGGNIFISSAMIEFAKSEAEIAAVLAHEISHVDLRQTIERFQYELLMRRIVPSSLAAISRLPYSFLLVAYSEQQEREADIDAIIIMAKAGYHPKHGLSLYDRMGAIGHEKLTTTPPRYLTEEFGTAVWEALKEYFQTHPSWPERTAEIIQVLRRNKADWKNRRFYTGRINHAQRIAWTSKPIESELRPYEEPPAYPEYISTETHPHFKAMAAHMPSGLSAIISNEGTPAAAATRALSACTKKIERCELYALGDRIVLNMTKNEVDKIEAAYYQNIQVERAFRSYLSKDDFKALAFDVVSGRWRAAVGMATVEKAVDKALTQCAEETASCELYAVGDVALRGLAKPHADAAIERYRRKVAAERINKLPRAHLADSYVLADDFKALAFDPTSGFTRAAAGLATPEKAVQKALAQCSEESNTCELYAVGDVVVQGLPKPLLEAAIKQYRLLGIARLITRLIAKVEQHYLETHTYDKFRALAVDYRSGQYAVSEGQPTPSKAIERAIEDCSTRSAACQLHAIGDKVVRGKSKSERDDIARLYGRKVIEHLFGDRFSKYRKKGSDFKAFVVDVPTLYYFYTTRHWHPLAAVNYALNWCRRRHKNCELAALGNNLVFDRPKRDLIAMIDDYHAQVVWPADVPNPLHEYMTEPRFTDFKAFAADPHKRAWRRTWGYASPHKAIERALSKCRSRNPDCELYAVGNQVVYGKPDKEQQTIIAIYAREEIRLRLKNSITQFSHFKAVAGNPVTMEYFIAYSRNTAQDAIEGAMKLCKARHATCELFFVGNTCVMGMPPSDITKITEQYQSDLGTSPNM